MKVGKSFIKGFVSHGKCDVCFMKLVKVFNPLLKCGHKGAFQNMWGRQFNVVNSFRVKNANLRV